MPALAILVRHSQIGVEEWNRLLKEVREKLSQWLSERLSEGVIAIIFGGPLFLVGVLSVFGIYWLLDYSHIKIPKDWESFVNGMMAMVAISIPVLLMAIFMQVSDHISEKRRRQEETEEQDRSK